ncbi:putative RNA-directed DNA polymerase [Arabidopsis thaliana]
MNVLSHMIDEAAVHRNIGYHPKCEKIGLTHLCFADDLMVFVDGHQWSIEGVINVFKEFAGRSGLQISLEKSTIYLAGVSASDRVQTLSSFPFANGQLPVRYLGLPLLTKQMTTADYSPLIEAVKTKISSWTARSLSYAGRLALLNSVIVSIANFWMSAYRLPAGCIREIEKLCSAFLWSGPVLNPKKAKIAWSSICQPKKEGGLGIKSLAEANKVSCLKLIWRLLSTQPSLWVTWIRTFIIRKGTFWSANERSSLGSWMWKKLLKYRELAKSMHKVEVRNGSSTSFWYDHWSHLGRLLDITGTRRVIDLGIPLETNLETVLRTHQHRQHRAAIYNRINAEIQRLQQQEREAGPDISLWRSLKNDFNKRFITKVTWNNVRTHQPQQNWYKGVWFPYSTPKYSFLLWLTVQNRLSTGDRIKAWNSGQLVTCTLCNNAEETRDHLFFSCQYTSYVWEALTQRLLSTNYSQDWNRLFTLLCTSNLPRDHLFLFRYVFQASIYHIWRERNARRHGEISSPTNRLIKLIDKTVRNRISSIRDTGDHNYNDCMQLWFSMRQPHSSPQPL